MTNDYERTADTETANLGGIVRLYYGDPLHPGATTGLGRRRLALSLGDHLGSTDTVIDMRTSEVMEKVSYDANGTVENDYRPSRWGLSREKYKFTGKEEDVEVGLVYFGARYLNTHLRRWISPDPLTIHASAADPNPYAYVGGRTLAMVDPFGLDGHYTGPGEIEFDDDPIKVRPPIVLPEERITARPPERPHSAPEVNANIGESGMRMMRSLAHFNLDRTKTMFATVGTAGAVERGHSWRENVANMFADPNIMNARVTGVSPDSPAAKLGVVEGTAAIILLDTFVTGGFFSGGKAAANTLGAGARAAEGEGVAVGAGLAKVSAAGGESNIVYRGLAAGEDAAAGPVARAPGATNAPLSHVAGKIQSQWISTTKNLAVATENYGQNGVVAIDLSKVPGQVVDLSGGVPGARAGTRLWNYAVRDSEVLIQGSVPPQAILWFRAP